MKDYKTLFLFFIGLFIIYWLIFVLTPKNNISINEQNRIDSLNISIKNIQKTQEILETKLIQLILVSIKLTKISII